MLRNLFVASAFVVFTSSIAVISAQQDDAKGASAATSHADASKHDQMIASCVALANQEELIISELGRQKATNDEVRKFSETMITDHHTFLTKLKKFAPEATQPGYLDKDGDSTKEAHKGDKKKDKIQQTAGSDDDKSKNDKPGKDDKADAVQTAAATTTSDPHHAGHHGDMMAIQRELAQECLALSKEKLKDKVGPEFDQCLMGMQISMHMGMKAKLAVFHRHATGELATILGEGLKTTDHHLAKAEDIMKTLDHRADKSEKREARKERREEKADANEAKQTETKVEVKEKD